MEHSVLQHYLSFSVIENSRIKELAEIAVVDKRVVSTSDEETKTTQKKIYADCVLQHTLPFGKKRRIEKR